MLDILFFALISVFICIKLFKALGDKQYNHDEHYKNLEQLKEILDKATKKMYQIALNTTKITDCKDETAINIIKEINNEHEIFTEEYFKEGARKVFEKVIQAYSQGDLNTLKEWLEPKIYEQFKREIDKRKEKNHLLNVTIVKIKNVQIISGEITQTHYKLEVKFSSEQVIYLTDDNERTIQGSKDRIEELEDIWVFTREKSSHDPKWYLLATK